MDTNNQNPAAEISFNKDNLYKEETFTDLQSGSIKHLIPVKTDGSPDESRPPMFMAQAQIMSAAGPLPIQCVLEANNLEEAIAAFPGAVKQTVDKIIEEAKRLRMEEASRIVVPDAQTTSKIIT